MENNLAPRISLDHIIKERYPTFIDALRDLDDALSMLFLFANLPSTQAVPAKTIALCQRLCREFEHYLIISHSLRKSFLSIKGIYYQATIQGQDILWLVPYSFVQQTSGDIDFRILGTFVEFYTTLIGFVNFRLYTSMGLVYPPKFNANADDRGGELGAFTLEGRGLTEPQQPAQTSNGSDKPSTKLDGSASTRAQAIADSLADLPEPEDQSNAQMPETYSPEDPESTMELDKFEPIAPDADVLPQPQISSNEAASLFVPFTFYLSRETPRHHLEFLLKAFGCKRVGWDVVLGDGAFVTSESDPRITHQVVDRPPLPASALPPEREPDGTSTNGANSTDGVDNTKADSAPRPGQRYPNRTYIQPQWVWDCINEGRLLRPDLYAPGAELPPHLSPWVKPKKGQYDPTRPLEQQELDGEAAIAEAEEEEKREIEEAGNGDKKADAEDRFSEASTGGDEDLSSEDPLLDLDVAGLDEDEDEEADSVEPVAIAGNGDEDEWPGFESDDAEPSISLHQRELEAEAADLPLPATDVIEKGGSGKKSEELRRQAARKQREEEEELERRKAMMSRRKRKTLERMMYGNTKRDAEAERLRAKRRKIEKAGGVVK